MQRVVIQHFDLAAKMLDRYYEQSGLATHSDALGQSREGFVKLFLKGNLPSIVDYSTGQILGHDDSRSKQIDIILQSAFSPRLQLFGDIHIAFIDYVICAIEVKSTITTANWENPSELLKILNASKSIKGLSRDNLLTKNVDGEQTTINTPYCVFAYCGPALETMLDKIQDYRRCFGADYDSFAPDVIAVLDRRYTLVRNNGWLYRKSSEHPYVHFGGEDTLVNLFAYLTTLLEIWNHTPHFTDFKRYVLPS